MAPGSRKADGKKKEVTLQTSKQGAVSIHCGLKSIHSNASFQTVPDQQSNDSGEDFGIPAVNPKASTLDDITTPTGSQKTSKLKAFDIAHFFLVVTRDNGEKKRICKECG